MLEVSKEGPATGQCLAGAAVGRANLATRYNLRRPVGYSKDFIDKCVIGKTF
ncbi:MAG: hypothetical protein OXN84_19450 [Albidovulum sp.]|nr:hypothetical protein [Albidovulum sp.]